MWLAALTAAAVIGFARTAAAEEDMLSGFSRGAVLRDLRSIRADHWELTGGNLTVRGNVFIPAGDYEIRLGSPDYTGRLCVIGADLKRDAIKALFAL